MAQERSIQTRYCRKGRTARQNMGMPRIGKEGLRQAIFAGARSRARRRVRSSFGRPMLMEDCPQWQQDDRPAERRQAEDAHHRRARRQMSLGAWLGFERRI